jgi:hypothetical protein
LAHDVAGNVRGNGKTDAHVAAGRRNDRRVDADQLTVEIDQGSAGVTGIDRRVGLNEAFVRFRVQAASAKRADDSRRHGLTQSKRVADRYDEVANLQSVRIRQRYLMQILGFYFQHGNIGQGRCRRVLPEGGGDR